MCACVRASVCVCVHVFVHACLCVSQSQCCVLQPQEKPMCVRCSRESAHEVIISNAHGHVSNVDIPRNGVPQKGNVFTTTLESMFEMRQCNNLYRSILSYVIRIYTFRQEI